MSVVRSTIGLHVLGLMHCLAWAGVYARLQPAAAGFQKEVGGDVREVLEAALARHSTLSEGDWLTAEHAGRTFDLRVQKLRPAAAVSVIGAPRSGTSAALHPVCSYPQPAIWRGTFAAKFMRFWLECTCSVHGFPVVWSCRN